MSKEFLTVKEVTEKTGLGRTKIYEEINSGALKAKKCGTRTLISEESYKIWVSNLPEYLLGN